MTVITVIVFWFIFLSIMVATSSAVDTITANQTIRDDGNSTIESAGGLFELGFFSPGKYSKNRYLGIWYKKIATGTVVWVANRKIPLTDNSGVLRVNGKGILVLVDSTGSIIWSSNFLRYMKNPVAKLLDTGNLVIRDEYDNHPENFVWQSFDHPGDTLLPGMKIGWGLTMDLGRSLTSWESAEDPSPGDFILEFNRKGYPQLLLSQNSDVQFRFGPWNGNQFSGQPILDSSFASSFVLNDKEIYYIFDVISGPNSRMVLNPNGNIQLLTWIDRTQSWEINPSQPAQRDNCDHYAVCGAYGSCYLTKYQMGTCGCMTGFVPKNLREWNSADWSGGCVRKAALNCSGDGFLKYSGLKLPDTRQSWFNQSMSLEDCMMVCLRNCYCTAYSNIDIKYGSGCLLWFRDLIDMRHEENGQDLYIRMAGSQLEELRISSRRKKLVKIIVIPVMVVLIIFLSIFLIIVSNKRRLERKLRRRGILTLKSESASTNAIDQEEFEIPLLDFERIVNATSNFSHKLGQGGFGPVYKGVLDGGQEIAVKRLSRNSKQGRDEFKTEVSCIAKLQHRNLVSLLGCCIEEGEMLLIYEYMPNKSLDSFIFDRELRTLLDWPKRYNIIKGIAKGLLYLHEDSRLRIIHRDLKASNVLLDYAMNPKISDFGMARIFGGSETEDNTRRIVGTYGYMSPEYAIDGLFSIKSDVYSFGVLLLEIVSGKKIRSFHHPDHNLNLLGSAWKLYEEGKFLELIDGVIAESCNQFELLRAIQIGLLCVQPYARDRPSMSFVVAMLNSEIEIPQPKQPGFFTARQLPESEPSKLKFSLCKELTVTFYAPR